MGKGKIPWKREKYHRKVKLHGKEKYLWEMKNILGKRKIS